MQGSDDEPSDTLDGRYPNPNPLPAQRPANFMSGLAFSKQPSSELGFVMMQGGDLASSHHFPTGSPTGPGSLHARWAGWYRVNRSDPWLHPLFLCPSLVKHSSNQSLQKTTLEPPTTSILSAPRLHFRNKQQLKQYHTEDLSRPHCYCDTRNTQGPTAPNSPPFHLPQSQTSE